MTKEHWRLYRHYLSEISDDSLGRLLESTMREVTARSQRDASIARLFLTSLPESDLATALELLELEIGARVDDAQQAILDGYRAEAEQSKLFR